MWCISCIMHWPFRMLGILTFLCFWWCNHTLYHIMRHHDACHLYIIVEYIHGIHVYASIYCIHTTYIYPCTVCSTVCSQENFWNIFHNFCPLDFVSTRRCRDGFAQCYEHGFHCHVTWALKCWRLLGSPRTLQNSVFDGFLKCFWCFWSVSDHSNINKTWSILNYSECLTLCSVKNIPWTLLASQESYGENLLWWFIR